VDEEVLRSWVVRLADASLVPLLPGYQGCDTAQYPTTWAVFIELDASSKFIYLFI
jgi:hypothetical protein